MKEMKDTSESKSIFFLFFLMTTAPRIINIYVSWSLQSGRVNNILRRFQDSWLYKRVPVHQLFIVDIVRWSILTRPTNNGFSLVDCPLIPGFRSDTRRTERFDTQDESWDTVWGGGLFFRRDTKNISVINRLSLRLDIHLKRRLIEFGFTIFFQLILLWNVKIKFP